MAVRVVLTLFVFLFVGRVGAFHIEQGGAANWTFQFRAVAGTPPGAYTIRAVRTSAYYGPANFVFQTVTVNPDGTCSPAGRVDYTVAPLGTGSSNYVFSATGPSGGAVSLGVGGPTGYDWGPGAGENVTTTFTLAAAGDCPDRVGNATPKFAAVIQGLRLNAGHVLALVISGETVWSTSLPESPGAYLVRVPAISVPTRGAFTWRWTLDGRPLTGGSPGCLDELPETMAVALTYSDPEPTSGTPTPTPTPGATPTPTPTATPNYLPTPTRTPTPSGGPTPTPNVTPTPSLSPSLPPAVPGPSRAPNPSQGSGPGGALTPDDVYQSVRRALEDAGNSAGGPAPSSPGLDGPDWAVTGDTTTAAEGVKDKLGQVRTRGTGMLNGLPSRVPTAPAVPSGPTKVLYYDFPVPSQLFGISTLRVDLSPYEAACNVARTGAKLLLAVVFFFAYVRQLRGALAS